MERFLLAIELLAAAPFSTGLIHAADGPAPAVSFACDFAPRLTGFFEVPGVAAPRPNHSAK
jgi:hypothetical protein